MYKMYMKSSPSSLSETGNTLSEPNSSVKMRVRAVNSAGVVPAVGNTIYSLDKPPEVLVIVFETELEVKEEVDVGIGVEVVAPCVFLGFDIVRVQESSSLQAFSPSLSSPPVAS